MREGWIEGSRKGGERTRDGPKDYYEQLGGELCSWWPVRRIVYARGLGGLPINFSSFGGVQRGRFCCMSGARLVRRLLRG